MNDYIEEMCMKHGTYIFNNLNINRNIEQLASKYGTHVYHG